MGLLDLFITAVALSMDAFAVSVSKGLSVKRVRLKHGLITGAYFGGFQALMPLLGFFEALSGEEEEMNDSFSFKTMLPLAVATSIDALATGVSFAVTDTNIWLAIALAGATTFAFSAAGVKIGNVFGAKYKSKAELAGGLILILMGAKILIEHLTGAA